MYTTICHELSHARKAWSEALVDPCLLSGRMIRLHAPPPLSRQQIVSISQPPYVSPVQLTDGRMGGGGCGAE
jgi:hypothetical protein